MQNIPIVFITDNGYVVPTIIAIESLIKNSTQKQNLSIKVVYSNLTEDNKQYLMNCGKNTHSVELISFDIERYVQYQKKKLYVTPTSLIKFELANIFNSYDKILYLDGDIIVRKDMSELLDVDIEDHYCAAVKDIESSIVELSAQRLKLNSYFNSGIMLLNLRKIRHDCLSTKMFDVKNNRLDLYYMDQDVLNLVFNDDVKYLPVRYNYIKNSYLNSRFDIEFINEFFSSDYNNIEEMDEDAVIVHMAGAKKPWKNKDAICSNEWMDYYQSSPIRTENLNLLPSKRKNILKEMIKKIVKRRSEITSKGEYEIKIYAMGVHILSKIRKNTHIEYKLFGYFKMKNQSYNER